MNSPHGEGCEICAENGTRLRDFLTAPERAELANVMMNEPVRPGDTISHQTARALRDKGLISRERCVDMWGESFTAWRACWEQIKTGRPA